jgi:hypothetical protein
MACPNFLEGGGAAAAPVSYELAFGMTNDE